MEVLELPKTRIDSVKTPIMQVHAEKYLHVDHAPWDASVSMLCILAPGMAFKLLDEESC